MIMCRLFFRGALIGLLAAVMGFALAQADQFTEADLKKWHEDFMTVVQEGERLFHSSELGTNSVSCDMCHPHASNSHPETYPKVQKQIGKVVALRDMINWCIKNPLEGEGKELAADDPKMIALEAYITWERRGVELAPGKH